MKGEAIDVEVTYAVGSESAQTQQYTFIVGEEVNSPSVVTTGSSSRYGFTSALEFKLRISAGVQKTITQVETRIPGNTANGQEVRNSITGFNNGNDNEFDLSIVDGEDEFNQSGYRNANGNGKSLSVNQTHALGSSKKGKNASFRNGAELDVFLGDFTDDTEIRYGRVWSESKADIIVTFKFSDGPDHDVYLDVTNVD
jgi:hypothetical protein